MTNIVTKQIQSQQEWEKFLSKYEDANFLQSWYWGEFHKRLGKEIFYTGFYDEEKLIGVMLSIIESAKRGKYLTVPAGPIIDWKNKYLVSAVFEEMKKIAQESKCVFVRIRPQLIEDEFSRNIFNQQGCISAPMYMHAELTSQLIITKSEEELIANMRKTTRYEIRKAEKIDVKVTTSKDEKLIKQFYELQLETAKRQQFVPFSYKYFFEQFKVFFEAEKALLYTATFEGKILAQAFIIFYNTEAVYHYAVSTEEGRKYPGAYLLQWEVIKEAKKRGMKRYNFWGVAPVASKDHRFSGISIFKRGFGGEDVQYLHAQDLIINYPKYMITYVIEQIRKVVRRV
ncbi:MAG TPA: peptidoglycan bridge formation glycyltransferase FemA/FemB family protein [Patescibacteria group bacterium]|nr:peptidoglycan bridge formation glycyltransferase FemA/FemB family protein [Patescibacteria group bacterium]